MKITHLLKKSGIELNPPVSTKEEAIEKLVELMDSTGNLIDKEEYKKAVLEREKLTTTGIGRGIAIPHAKSEAVKKPGLSAMVIKDGLDYESLDGEVANLFFMIAVPKKESDIHLDVLARLCTMLMDKEFKNSLINANNKDEFLRLIDEKENDKVNKEELREDVKENQKYRILAVTACPTGIAHTYMAAESLEKKGEEMGISLKVETNGSSGTKNVLTKKDIENAECIIVAADKKVDMARFHGKRVIETKVASGIHKAEELINQAISGNVPVYNYNLKNDDKDLFVEKNNIFQNIYRHLMYGFSYMLPFVIAGGILISLSYFISNDYKLGLSKFGYNIQVTTSLKNIGYTAFDMVLPILSGFIAISIGDTPALAVGVVGGMLSNKSNAGFLGALFIGFIAGYLVLGLKKAFLMFPKSIEGLKPVLFYPLIGVLLIGAISIFVTNPIFSYLHGEIIKILNNMNAVDKTILGAILGGIMALDMGGPINKMAYVFGTAFLLSGELQFMASVMIGGMVPPLAIALATTFFRNKFTKEERELGVKNYIKGLCFITEGAIPFVSKDPLRVITSCTIGSSIAGALSMIFGCAVRVPHGGIFILPIMDNPFGYFIALIIGSLIGMMSLGILKKKVNVEKSH